MVILGGVLALVPGLPRRAIDSDIVFLVFLPPLFMRLRGRPIYRTFIKNLRPIALLAFGLVLVTTAGCRVRRQVLRAGYAVGSRFRTGSNHLPTDAIAATAITQRLRVPKRIVVILERREPATTDAQA